MQPENLLQTCLVNVHGTIARKDGSATASVDRRDKQDDRSKHQNGQCPPEEAGG